MCEDFLLGKPNGFTMLLVVVECGQSYVNCLFYLIILNADMDFAQEIYELDCSLHEELFLGNSSSESHSPGLGGTSNSAVGISESSMEIIPDYKWKNDPHNERIGCGVHHTRSKCECQAPTEDSLDLISKNMQNLDELDDDEKPLVSFLLSTKNEKNSGRTAKCSTHLEQKRMRRPTRRYIEEFSGLKTRQTMNGEVLTIASDDNHLKVRSHN